MSNTQSIEFTQFLRPHGERAKVAVDRPKHITSQAERLQRFGCRFEVEVLTTGEVCLEVLAPWHDEGDPVSLAMLIVPNGPGVPQAVDALVAAATVEYVARKPVEAAE